MNGRSTSRDVIRIGRERLAIAWSPSVYHNRVKASAVVVSASANR